MTRRISLIFLSFLSLALGLTTAGPAEAVIPSGFSEVVILGTNSVWLEDGVVVTEGDVVVNDAATLPTLSANHELTVGGGASTPAGWAVEANRIKAHRTTSFGGDLLCNELSAPGNPATCAPPTLPVFPFLPPFVTGPSDGPDVAVRQGEEIDLPAGTYGDLVLKRGATVRFSGGIYSFKSIDTNQDCQLLFLAPSEVRVAESFASGHGSTLGPAAGSGVSAAEVVFYVAGENAPAGPSPNLATMQHETRVDANFYVPSGTLSIGRDSLATGAFLGLDVKIGQGTRVTLDTFFFNRPPVGADDSATVAEGSSVSVLDSGETSLLANDTDPDGDNLAVSPTPAVFPAHGAVVLNPDGTFTYTHDGSETLSDSFVYEVCDDGVEPGPLCDTATVAITVTPVNDPPVANDDSTTVDQGGTVTILDSGETSVLANDTDVDSINLTATLVTAPQHAAAFTLNPDGTFSYTDDGSRDPIDTFTYQVCDDGTPQGCDIGTVTVNVVAVSNTVANPQTVDTNKDTPIVITLTGSADPADLPLIFSILTPPANGTTTAPTAQSSTSARTTYNPDAGFTGTDQFTFQVVDQQGFSASAVVTVNVTDESGDAQVTAFDLAVSTDQGVALSITLRATTTLAETIDFSIATSPANGTLGSLTTDPDDPDVRLVTYTPDAGFSGADGFTFEACVLSGTVCDTGTISITVRPVSIQVSIVKQGTGTGRVSSSPAGIDCGLVCSAGFSSDETIFLAAVPDEGSVFSGWSGDADCADGRLTPNGNKNCIATFDPEPPPPVGQVVISVAVSGTGNGNVTSSPAGIDCGSICSATFDAFTRVELTPTADPGSEFVGWGGSGDCLDGVLQTDRDASCIAFFDALPAETFTLQVIKLGAGDGTVVSSPSGISCGGVCSAEFVPGTEVRLSTRPDEGSVFLGWSGDCVADPPGSFFAVVTVDDDKTCEATYGVAP